MLDSKPAGTVTVEGELLRTGAHGRLYVSGEGGDPPTPTHLCIWVLFNLQNTNPEVQQIPHLCFPVRFLHCHRFARALCRSTTAAACPQPCPAARRAGEGTTAVLVLSNFHMLDLLSEQSFLPIQLCSR